MKAALIDLAYLSAALLFVFGLKQLSKPSTATRGNRLAALGMLIAIAVTLFDRHILSPTYIVAGLVTGSAIGAVMALKVRTTSMPQLVGFFNGMGGAASAVVAWSHLQFAAQHGVKVEVDVNVTIILSIVVGAITFTGSLVACAKLIETPTFQRLFGGSVSFPLQKTISILMFGGCIALGILFGLDPFPGWELYAMLGLASVLGVILVLPIGGADMPVVIALLNAFSGVAAALTGFVLANKMLIIAGSLVGASGLILTDIMCKGMNRTLWSVLFSAFGGDAGGTATLRRRSKDEVPHRTAEDAAIVLQNAQTVIITPGYGLAVAQAQHDVRELCDMLERNGTDVKYAIHPVAGRMPGHMNVLLAEANVPYDKMYSMEEINDAFGSTDVCLIIGANDVTNPDARTNSGPLQGMPILNCDYARTVMIIKRSLSAGYAGVDNPLFYTDKSMMLFGDAKKMVKDIIEALKE